MSEQAGNARTPSEGRRHLVTVLFSDLCGYTALNEEADPEDTDELKKKLEALSSGVIKRHGGSISQVYGDGVLAVFGYPDAQEDASRKALEAAIELHALVRTSDFAALVPRGFEVRLHSGIHAGLVFVRAGDALHGRYELTGDAVNTTARLCSLAERDQILVSDAVLSGIEAFFDARERPDVALKGKKLPVRVFDVRGRTGVRTRFEARSQRGLTSFIGREAELDRLLQLVAEEPSGKPHVAVVRGGPGIGKTRLLEELGRRASDKARVLRGVCESYGEMAPLEPFAQVLRQLFGISPATDADAARLAIESKLAERPASASLPVSAFMQLLSLVSWPVGEGRAADRATAAKALADLVIASAEGEPLVLVLDDWQWADDASRNVLDALRRHEGRQQLVIFVGARAGEQLDPSLERVETLQLRPFTEPESSRVISALRPRLLDLGVARAIHQRSGGNPLFLEELCRLLPDHALAGEHAFEEAAIPTTLHGLIQARVNRLPAPISRLLRVAAVIGNELSASLLARVVPDADLPAQIEELTRGDLLYSTGAGDALRFKHGLTREVIYEGVRIAERRELHRAIAIAIEQGASATTAHRYEALAHHYRGSADHERAASYSELAGDEAMLTSALDRARFHYSNVLFELDSLPVSVERRQKWLAVCLKWAGVYVYSPSRMQVETLQRAAAHAAAIDDVGARAHIAHWRNWIHYVLGEYEEAIEHGREALALASRAGDERLETQLLSSLGQCHAAAGDHLEALRLLEQGIERKRARAGSRASRVSVAQGYAYALGCRAAVHADRGDLAQASSDIEEAIGTVSGSGHAIEGSVAAFCAMIHLYRGDWGACVRSADHGRSIAERVKSAYVFAMCTAFRGYARFMLERSEESLLEMRSAAEWLEARDTGLFSGFNYGCFAEAFASAGQALEAREYASRALERSEAGDLLGQSMAYRALARLAAEAGPEDLERERLLELSRASAQKRDSRRDLALTELLAAELYAMHETRTNEAIAKARHARTELEAMGLRYHARCASELCTALEPERAPKRS